MKTEERRKREAEEMRDTELSTLEKINEAFEDEDTKSHPLSDQIEQCEYLKRYCQRQMKGGENQGGDQEDSKLDSKKSKKNTELQQKLEKGAIELAPTKEEKLAVSVF